MRKIFKSNIMLLVLFIMFISSLLGLLVTQYTRDMITISSLFTKYYTTYFHAYGGLELGLAQINYRTKNDIEKQNPFGYEDSAVFTDFTECSLTSCGFTMNVNSRGSIITDSTESYTGCTAAMSAGEGYSIDVGDGFIIPLFYDISTGFSVADYEVITNTGANPAFFEFENLDPEMYTDGTDGEEYIIKILDEEVLNYDVFVEPTIDDATPYSLSSTGLVPYHGAESPENKNYLIIANATGSVKEFCLELGGSGPTTGSTAALPTKYMRVSSSATNNDITVSFGALKTNELPSYLIYGTINP